MPWHQLQTQRWHPLLNHNHVITVSRLLPNIAEELHLDELEEDSSKERHPKATLLHHRTTITRTLFSFRFLAADSSHSSQTSKSLGTMLRMSRWPTSRACVTRNPNSTYHPSCFV